MSVCVNLVEELMETAIKKMETVMADITTGNKRMAYIGYGIASVYAEMLEDLGCYLEDEDEHYANMIEIYEEWEGKQHE